MKALVIVGCFLLLTMQVGLAESQSIPVKFVQVTLLDEADLAAPESGRCFELLVKEGQLIDRGALLVRLDDTQESIEVTHATKELEIARLKSTNKIDVEIAQKAEGAAKSKLKRKEDSRAKYPKSIPEEEIEELRFLAQKTASEIAKAKFDLELAQHEAELAANALLSAKDKLDRRQVRSPINGMVVEVDVNEGEWVETGRKLVRVVRLDRLRVAGFVPLKYLPDELIGQDAELTLIREGRENVSLTVQIGFVSPEANPVSGERRIWVEIDNSKGTLFPGMTAKLEINAAKKP
ncbi:MAG: HlyD family efflux transporter periplasmic adaptor subunit [Planctomycetaceae bacterium]|nr:HlyD family efflux transporter periplasmic adaptor subunit [Planctomycetaceae bacterium]MDG2389256.1 HlyD family efflux transporter periplasmic adaptor subunit [Planctomycetaceae bacterium]